MKTFRNCKYSQTFQFMSSIESYSHSNAKTCRVRVEVQRTHIFVQIQSLILSGKNILQELLSRELKTMRHVSFIKNLDNLDAYRYSDRQSSNFLTIEIQSNLNLRGNGSYAAKSIECSNYKQGCTFSVIKQVLNKIIQLLPCHVLVLSFGRILNHIENFID